MRESVNALIISQGAASEQQLLALATEGLFVTRDGGEGWALLEVELPAEWDPAADARLTAWETVHQLIRVLEAGGESAAAVLAAKLGSKAEAARELAYRLYTICDRKKRAAEALSYNALVQSWPEIVRLAQEGGKAKPIKPQAEMFEETDE